MVKQIKAFKSHHVIAFELAVLNYDAALCSRETDKSDHCFCDTHAPDGH
jgi:hypothetical protein